MVKPLFLAAIKGSSRISRTRTLIHTSLKVLYLRSCERLLDNERSIREGTRDEQCLDLLLSYKTVG